MPTGIIEILDEVNVRLRGVPASLIQDAQSVVTWHVPGFKFMHQHQHGRWDGKIRLMSTTGRTFLNLLDTILPVFENAGYDFEIDDQRHDWSSITDAIELPDTDIFAHRTWDGTESGDPIVLRDYQLDAVHTALTTGQGLLELATGAGKTLICATLAAVYSKYGKVVIIVPNIDLVIQTQALFKKCGLDTGIWYGEMKDAKDITISTWQSLEHCPELMAGVVACVVDEAHQAKSKTLSEIMTGPASHVPFRFGCTGTVPKEDLYRNQICGTIGPVIFMLKAWELQQRGVLASSDVLQMSMVDSKNFTEGSRPDFEDWADQLDWIFKNPARLSSMVDTIRNSAEEIGNVLVLVPHRAHGKAIAAAIPGSISLDGGDKSKHRQEVYKWFNDNDNNVLICTSGIASTGLDIPRMMVLVMIEPGKKFEKIIQSVGRGLRRGDGKTHITIIDIFSDTAFSKKHATARARLYKEAKISCHKVSINYANS